MEHFLIPADKERLVSWLLKTANYNNWTIVLEYGNQKTYTLLAEYATEVPLPPKARHQFHADYQLTAVKNLHFNDRILQKIMGQCATLSVHTNYEMLFLITDEFDEECFSCRAGFYKRYWQTMDEQDLIYAY